MTKLTCTRCGREIEYLEVFPGKLCYQCYDKKMRKIPLDELELPDFRKGIKV